MASLLKLGKACLVVLNTLLWWTPKLAQRSQLTGKTVQKAHTRLLKSGRSYLTATSPGFSLPMVLSWPMRKKASFLACWNVGIQNAKKCRPRKSQPKTKKKKRSGTSDSWSRRLTWTVCTVLFWILVVGSLTNVSDRVLHSQAEPLPDTWMPISMSVSQVCMITWAKQWSTVTQIRATLVLGLC